jgi:hypothetical protein
LLRVEMEGKEANDSKQACFFHIAK